MEHSVLPEGINLSFERDTVDIAADTQMNLEITISAIATATKGTYIIDIVVFDTNHNLIGAPLEVTVR